MTSSRSAGAWQRGLNDDGSAGVSSVGVPASERRSLLVIVPRVPWPPRRSGFSVRYFPLLRHLAARHSVHLMVLGDREAWSPDSPFGPGCTVEHVDVSGRRPSLAARVGAIARGLLPGRVPYSMRSVWTPDITRAVNEAGRRNRYDVVLWAGPEYLEAALQIARRAPASRVVFDLVDSPTLIATRARKNTAAGEIEATRSVENEMRAKADLTIYISSADSQASAPAQGTRTLVLPNGIYLDDLTDSAAAAAVPALPPRYVLFFGHMSFGPNVDGAGWLAREIMPAVREKLPDTRLIIVGHQPAPEVKALASEHTIVTGSVDSIWPYVKNAGACVFPLRLAAGLQNKILEALAMARGVVTTRQCAASVGAISGQHLLAGDTREEIVDATLALLGDEALAQRLGAAGSELVRRQFDWAPLTQRFEQELLG